MDYTTLTSGKSIPRPSNVYTESDLSHFECPVAAVYVLWTGQECLYVGHSGHLRARLAQHRKDKTFDRIEFYLEDDLDERLRLEGIMILALRPLLNKGLHLGVRPNRCWELAYAWAKSTSAARAKRRGNAKKSSPRKSKKKKKAKKAKPRA